MNILLINPPTEDSATIVREGRCQQRQEAWGTSWAPLTLAITASILRNEGFKVAIKDCPNDGISFNALKDIIRSFKPKLIIANTSTPSIDGDLKVAGIAKEIDNSVKTVFFGIHVTALPEDSFQEDSNVELIVSGEPEYTLRDLAITLREGKTLEKVKGLIRRSDGKIIHNEKRPFIENLDDLPFPAWDLINVKSYKLPISRKPFLLIQTGRGCPHSCKFCASKTFYGRKPRLRSPEKVVAEFKHVREKFQINNFLFWAEEATINKQQMIAICRGLEKDAPGVKWVCNSRVDSINEELLKRMKKAGCWMIGFGVEAGSQRVLDSMKKSVLIEDIGKAFALTKKAGIKTTAHVIVGHPGETRKDIALTSKLVKKLDPDYIQVYCCVPFPGSALFEEVEAAGWLKHKNWLLYEQNHCVINTPHLNVDEVMALRKKMIRAFYLNPAKVVKTVAGLESIGELIALPKFAKAYLKSWVK